MKKVNVIFFCVIFFINFSVSLRVNCVCQWSGGHEWGKTLYLKLSPFINSYRVTCANNATLIKGIYRRFTWGGGRPVTAKPSNFNATNFILIRRVNDNSNDSCGSCKFTNFYWFNNLLLKIRLTKTREIFDKNALNNKSTDK